MKYLLLGLCVLLYGCAAPSTLLVGPDGRAHRCAAYGQGLAGVSTAGAIHDSCVKDMKRLGYVELPGVSLGLQFDDVKNIPLEVSSVDQNSPAERGGMLKGDEILEIDNKEVKSFIETMKYLGQKKPGDEVEIAVRRDGKKKIFNLELASR